MCAFRSLHEGSVITLLERPMLDTYSTGETGSDGSSAGLIRWDLVERAQKIGFMCES